MDKCGKACPYNTLDGCKVKEYRAICPLTNMATPITEYKMTNADRIRAMSDEELATLLNKIVVNHHIKNADNCNHCPLKGAKHCDTEGIVYWLQQPAE